MLLKAEQYIIRSFLKTVLALGATVAIKCPEEHDIQLPYTSDLERLMSEVGTHFDVEKLAIKLSDCRLEAILIYNNGMYGRDVVADCHTALEDYIPEVDVVMDVVGRVETSIGPLRDSQLRECPCISREDGFFVYYEGTWIQADKENFVYG